MKLYSDIDVEMCELQIGIPCKARRKLLRKVDKDRLKMVSELGEKYPDVVKFLSLDNEGQTKMIAKQPELGDMLTAWNEEIDKILLISDIEQLHVIANTSNMNHEHRDKFLSNHDDPFWDYQNMKEIRETISSFRKAVSL